MHTRIKQLRKALKLNLKDFSEPLNYTAALISKVEHGSAAVSSNLIESIINAYGVRREWLEDGSGEMFADPSKTIAKPATPGERVRYIRDLQDMNGDEFAKAIGYSSTQLFSVEKNLVPTTSRMIFVIATTFGVCREWLEDGTGPIFDTRRKASTADDARKIICLEFFDALPPDLQDVLIDAISERVALSRVRRRADDDASKTTSKNQINNGTVGGPMIQR